MMDIFALSCHYFRFNAFSIKTYHSPFIVVLSVVVLLGAAVVVLSVVVLLGAAVVVLSVVVLLGAAVVVLSVVVLLGAAVVVLSVVVVLEAVIVDLVVAESKKYMFTSRSTRRCPGKSNIACLIYRKTMVL
jgi:hypothetical protein